MRLSGVHGAFLGVLLVGAGAAMTTAAVRTSTTFDEIVLVSSGVRVLEHGGVPLAVDQPPLASYLYAFPVWASRPALPDENARSWDYDLRWEYARDLYFRLGNDPRRVALLGRSVAILMALGLVALAFAWGRRIAGPGAGLLAGGLTAFLPDLLAHGAVAYNDVPLALAFLAALWALDALVRRPGVGKGIVAGLLVAAALGVKYSAVALAPVAAVLLLLEAGARGWRDAPWWTGVARGGAVAVVAWYVGTVLLYRGDFWLISLEGGLRFTAGHAAAGHPAPAYLLGETRPGGFWYFFPVAFLFKTPAALHLLLPVAAWGLWRRRGGLASPAEGADPRSPTGPPFREAVTSRLRGMAASPLRGPAVGAAVFGGFLLATGLDVGFRYALPALPPLLLLVAVGLVRFLEEAGARLRLAVGLLLLLYAGSTLSVAPFWIGYVSEWGRARKPGHEALLDSSVDWGQGLLALRGFMDEEGVERVRLSYFGSALPEAYGIAYEPLPSFLPLPPPTGRGGGGRDEAERPRFTVVAATNLHGLYFEGRDPLAGYRTRRPERVLAGSLYVYREE